MLKRGLRFEAKLCMWLGVLACVAGGTVASAQEQPAGEAPAEAEELAGPADEYGRGVPRSAMLGFQTADLAASYAFLKRIFRGGALDRAGRGDRGAIRE